MVLFLYFWYTIYGISKFNIFENFIIKTLSLKMTTKFLENFIKVCKNKDIVMINEVLTDGKLLIQIIPKKIRSILDLITKIGGIHKGKGLGRLRLSSPP